MKMIEPMKAIEPEGFKIWLERICESQEMPIGVNSADFVKAKLSAAIIKNKMEAGADD